MLGQPLNREAYWNVIGAPGAGRTATAPLLARSSPEMIQGQTASVPAGVVPPETIPMPASPSAPGPSPMAPPSPPPATQAPALPTPARDPDGWQQRLIDFVTNPLVQGIFGAATTAMMTPRAAGPAFGIGAALRGGGNAIRAAQYAEQQQMNEAANRQFLGAQAAKMARPPAPTLPYAKPNLMDASPESRRAYLDSMTPENPTGDPSLLLRQAPPPKTMSPLEEEHLRLKNDRLRALIAMAGNSERMSYQQLVNAHGSLQRELNSNEFYNYSEEEKDMVRGALKSVRAAMAKKTPGGMPEPEREKLPANDPLGIRPSSPNDPLGVR